MKKSTVETRLIVALAIFFMIAAIFLAFNPLPEAKAEPLETWTQGWRVVRATANEDGANFAAVIDLDAGEGNFANKPSGAFEIPANPPGTSLGASWCFTISGIPTNGDNDTFSFTVVGWAATNGMAQVICTGDGRLGTQDVVIYPQYNTETAALWADYLSVDGAADWPGNIGTYPATAADTVAQLIIDVTGLKWVQVIVYDADGSTSDEAGSITVFGRPY